MTTTQPSDAAKDAARELFTDLYVNFGNETTIARALDAFAKQQVRAAVEECCRLVCGQCDDGVAVHCDAMEDGEFWHRRDGKGKAYYCNASEIRAHFAELLAGKD